MVIPNTTGVKLVEWFVWDDEDFKTAIQTYPIVGWHLHEDECRPIVPMVDLDKDIRDYILLSPDGTLNSQLDFYPNMEKFLEEKVAVAKALVESKRVRNAGEAK